MTHGYTDEEIKQARDKAMDLPRSTDIAFLRAFLNSLPRRESPALADPEPAAQVPLGPEDYPPGSVLRFAEQHWYNALYVSCEVICLVSGDSVAWKDWNKLQDDGWQINTSLPDTGRWDKDAWRPCSKPAGKEVPSENTTN